MSEKSSKRNTSVQDNGEAERLPGVHYFPAESAGERWVYSTEFKGIEGWGRAARLKRAAGVAAELKEPDAG